MANSQRGEVSVVTEKKTHILKLSTNAICGIEEASGMGINAFSEGLSDPGNFKITNIRLMFMHGIANITFAEAGNIIDELGIGLASEKLGEAMKLAFPDLESDNSNAGK